MEHGVECDINIIKQYISPEKLEKLKLNWGYSTTKGSFIGFKVTVVLDEKILCPVSILIHSGAPNYTKLFNEIMEELKRRRIIKPKNILLFDRGYYQKSKIFVIMKIQRIFSNCSYENYNTGINQYQAICIIFPKSTFNIKKLEEKISYPLSVFKIKKKIKQVKSLYQNLKKLLLNKLKN
jgi:hypothetical protein